jgi:hypothetical protein
MMKTAHNESHINRIPSATKCAIALQAISRQQTITAIAKEFDCSRTTVHEQKNRALEAAAHAFEETDDETLFMISVTKSWIQKIVVALFLICGSSYRGVMSFLESILDYSLSLESVFNILDAAADQAVAMNAAYDLSSIQSSAADEVFHRNQPILGIVDNRLLSEPIAFTHSSSKIKVPPAEPEVYCRIASKARVNHEPPKERLQP